MRPERRSPRRLAAVAALVGVVALLSAHVAPAVEARIRTTDPHTAIGHHPTKRDAAHSGSPRARTTNRAQPGAAVLPPLAQTLALLVVAAVPSVRRRRVDSTAWRLEWSRGPPRSAFAATFA